LLAFSSCQKDNDLFQEVTPNLENTLATISEKEQTTEQDDAIDFTIDANTELETIEEDTNSEITMRSGRELLFSETYTISARTSKRIRQYKSDMQTGPDCRYEVEVIRHGGDPDLYIVGSNGQTVRQIRRAEIYNNGALEESYAQRIDLRAEEDRLYYWVVADQDMTARFKINIYRVCAGPTGGNGGNGGGNTNTCCTNVLNETWLQDKIEAMCSDQCTGEKIYCGFYNSLPVVHITPWESGCTDGMGYVYNCAGDLVETYGGIGGGTLQGNFLTNHDLLWDSETDCTNDNTCVLLQSENFEQRQIGDMIALNSEQWETWNPLREGTFNDPLVGRDQFNTSTTYLNFNRPENNEDVVYRLRNRTNGNYKLTFDIRVQGTGYFNIQTDQDNRVSGGVFGTYFRNDGRFYVRTNTGGQSNLQPYYKNQWVKVTIKADFTRNQYAVQIGNQTVNVISAANFNRLGGINFYTIDGADFQVDNIELRQCQ
ncbi:MAG: hypothetical protein AB8G22_12630, partial [Saprospiraceae bacterium]